MTDKSNNALCDVGFPPVFCFCINVAEIAEAVTGGIGKPYTGGEGAFHFCYIYMADDAGEFAVKGFPVKTPPIRLRDDITVIGVKADGADHIADYRLRDVVLRGNKTQNSQ